MLRQGARHPETAAAVTAVAGHPAAQKKSFCFSDSLTLKKTNFFSPRVQLNGCGEDGQDFKARPRRPRSWREIAPLRSGWHPVGLGAPGGERSGLATIILPLRHLTSRLLIYLLAQWIWFWPPLAALQINSATVPRTQLEWECQGAQSSPSRGVKQLSLSGSRGNVGVGALAGPSALLLSPCSRSSGEVALPRGPAGTLVSSQPPFAGDLGMGRTAGRHSLPRAGLVIPATSERRRAQTQSESV